MGAETVPAAEVCPCGIQKNTGHSGMYGPVHVCGGHLQGLAYVHRFKIEAMFHEMNQCFGGFCYHF